MGKVYLGYQFISDVYTHIKEIPVEKHVDVLKKPVSRYMVDEDGVAKPIEFDFTGAFDEITSVDEYGLYYAFENSTGITGSINFPNLTSISAYGLRNSFYGCTRINSVIFPKLTSIGNYGLNNAFRDCTGITGSINFPNLTSVGNNGLSYSFYGCTGITSVSFPKLTSIGTGGLGNAFVACTGITGSINFPNLTSFGTGGLGNAFSGCTGITELHFRADTQSVIKVQDGYSSKFGATNATIYFDL